MSVLRKLKQKSGFGKLAYECWYKPRGFIIKCMKEGPINLWLSARGQRAMEKAASSLRPSKVSTISNSPIIVFLTGKRFWYQTAFCIHSLLRHSSFPVRITIIDDGSLDETIVNTLNFLFPGIVHQSASETESRLNEFLPAERFPTLRSRRIVYPHLRKLTDVHVGTTGWKLVLDSDMLFFQNPEFMLSWLASPHAPFYLKDAIQSYGYSDALMAELTGCPVPEKLNVGACGLKSEEIDWEKLEHWCRVTIEREGTSYLQEQALSAMFGAGRPITIAPEKDYVVLPSKAETLMPKAILHHYVADSKAWYFRFGWHSMAQNRN